jgi:hypothetical protein
MIWSRGKPARPLPNTCTARNRNAINRAMTPSKDVGQRWDKHASMLGNTLQ